MNTATTRTRTFDRRLRITCWACGCTSVDGPGATVPQKCPLHDADDLAKGYGHFDARVDDGYNGPFGHETAGQTTARHATDDDRQVCGECGDDVYTLSSAGRCDGCEAGL